MFNTDHRLVNSLLFVLKININMFRSRSYKGLLLLPFFLLFFLGSLSASGTRRGNHMKRNPGMATALGVVRAG